MAIKKSEVGKLSKADQQYADAAEQYIDQKLNRQYRGPQSPTYVTVEFNELQRATQQSEAPNHLVQAELKRRYQEAGWTIKIEDDQREGTWFQFS